MEHEIQVQGMPVLDAREIQARVNLIQSVMRKVMEDGVHFGQIPGCPKPSLFKAGAEKLAATFQITVDSVVEDLSNQDEKLYRVTCIAYAANGVKLGSSVGVCSSSEEKYKWRKPKCQAEYDATEVDRRRLKWESDGSSLPQVRTEPADLANTILQMADKRAYVAVIRKVTAASDIFTQDIEDLGDGFISADNAPAAVKRPKPKFDTADFRVMKAKFPGDCPVCEGPIAKEEEIMYNSKLKKAYHPACIKPSEEKAEPEEPAYNPNEPAGKALIANLEKLAKQCGTTLIDRVGRDGIDHIEGEGGITRGYAEKLLKEFAERIDEEAK